jgi:serine/threonine protein kinase
MAPEVHEGQRYGWGADIWSLGVVFYQMLYDRLPYRGVNDWEILKKIKTTIPKFDDVDLSDDASDFIQRCLVYDPKSRITWK